MAFKYDGGGHCSDSHLLAGETPLYGGVNGAVGGWGVDGFAALPHYTGYLPYIQLLLISIALDKLWAVEG